MTASATYTNLYKDEILISTSEPVITLDEWEVKEMELGWPKIMRLWGKVNEHKSLFSDLTRNNFTNFVRYITQAQSIWLEIYQNGNLVGIICFTGMQAVVDIEVHMIIFDRHPAEKLPIVKEIIRYMFRNFPINRITAHAPEMFYGTIRLLKKVGFTEEGRKRQARCMSDKWFDVMIYGITREEVMSQCLS